MTTGTAYDGYGWATLLDPTTGDHARFRKRLACCVRSVDGCWLWNADKPNEYGRFRLSNGGRTSMKAHRVSWALKAGRPPGKGLDVCHTCDVPACVNPDHLFVGTRLDNMRDRNEKQRQARGERMGTAKLTERDVVAIRAMYGTGRFTLRQIAGLFEISNRQASGVVNGETWGHVA